MRSALIPGALGKVLSRADAGFDRSPTRHRARVPPDDRRRRCRGDVPVLRLNARRAPSGCSRRCCSRRITSTARTTWTSFDAGAAARLAYEAGTAGGSDVVELHDAFALEELVHYEDLGLCARRCCRAAALGATSLGGRIPVNSSGGLLARASAERVRRTRRGDIVQQLGEAGPRQRGARRPGTDARGNVNGLEMGAASVHILAR